MEAATRVLILKSCALFVGLRHLVLFHQQLNEGETGLLGVQVVGIGFEPLATGFGCFREMSEQLLTVGDTEENQCAQVGGGFGARRSWARGRTRIAAALNMASPAK